MRIVLDTNVFISGIFFSGAPSKILQAWEADRIRLVLSPSILEEYRRVAKALSKQYSQINIESIIELVAIHAEMVGDIELPESVCTDPDDDKFLACAVKARAEFICTGDKALLKTSGYQSVRVLTPSEFCREYL